MVKDTIDNHFDLAILTQSYSLEINDYCFDLTMTAPMIRRLISLM
jgi:hypothetical protein